jgi:enoyl reductase-like protein
LRTNLVGVDKLKTIRQVKLFEVELNVILSGRTIDRALNRTFHDTNWQGENKPGVRLVTWDSQLGANFFNRNYCAAVWKLCDGIIINLPVYFESRDGTALDRELMQYQYEFFSQCRNNPRWPE